MNGEHEREHEEGERPLAAEYALGVLSAAERLRAERRIASEPDFAAEVADWQARLAPLAEEVAPVEPPAGAWERIEARLPASRGERRAERRRLRDSLALWKAIAGAALGFAAVSFAALVGFALLPRLDEPQPYVARLAPDGGPAAFMAAFDPRTRAVIVAPASAGSNDARVPELWLIPPDGVPRSLGTFDPGQPSPLIVPEALAPHMNRSAALAVSLEPAGGSPTGRPTGPVVAQGPLRTF